MGDYFDQRLYDLGYFADLKPTPKDREAGIERFQRNHGIVFRELGLFEDRRGAANRFAQADGVRGPITAALAFADRTCGCPDIPRDAQRNELEEARIPNDCSRGLIFTHEFANAPGLTAAQTRAGINIALAEWNTAFDSPMNGRLYDEYIAEIHRMIGSPSLIRNFVLWVGTVKHEVGHALGLNHTPGDPESVLFPSMRGQWILNRTDIANLAGRKYKKGDIKFSVGEWKGREGSNVWSELEALGGSTLAYSYLTNGSCSHKIQQAYNSRTSWNSGSLEIPAIEGPPDPPPGPGPGDEFLDRVREIDYKDGNGKVIGTLRAGRVVM